MTKQSFHLDIHLSYTLEENIKNAEEWYKDMPDTQDRLREGMADGPLVKPVCRISFVYPYTTKQWYYFDEDGNEEKDPETKHELFARILEELPRYLERHPYRAPHAITDFVIEGIDVVPYNKHFAEARIHMGS